MHLTHVICKESLFASKRGEVYKAMDKAGVKSTQVAVQPDHAVETGEGWGWAQMLAIYSLSRKLHVECQRLHAVRAQMLAMFILSQKFAKKSEFATWLSVLPTKFDSPGLSPCPDFFLLYPLPCYKCYVACR